MTHRTIFTIGHSTRTLDDFIALLRAHGVTLLADVRTIPRSRHNPQFNVDSLRTALAAESIEYQHLREFGGLRHPKQDSPNGGWRNASFRGYADYMLTEQFVRGIESLIDESGGKGICLMCAEAVPWRCHRSLIADALLVRGLEVEHILSLKQSRPHHLTPFAEVHGLVVTYPL